MQTKAWQDEWHVRQPQWIALFQQGESRSAHRVTNRIAGEKTLETFLSKRAGQRFEDGDLSSNDACCVCLLHKRIYKLQCDVRCDRRRVATVDEYKRTRILPRNSFSKKCIWTNIHLLTSDDQKRHVLLSKPTM